jgi:hypothetical protein
MERAWDASAKHRPLAASVRSEAPPRAEAAVRAAPRARTARYRRRERRIYWLFTLPAVLLIGVFKLYPVIRGIGYSFTTWPGFGPSQFVGLKN